MHSESLGYLAAMLVGLGGGVHCVGMCGGVVGVLTLGAVQPDLPRGRAWSYLLGYNAGRLASYTLAGALMGGIGFLAGHLPVVHQGQLVLQVVAGLVMVAMGLYLGGWWFGLARIERVGGRLWRLIEPHARGLLPVRSVGAALALGAAWGWLPCGLVYSMLIWAISSASPGHGALLMLSFGVGTLPNLLAMGLFAEVLSRWVRKPWVRRLAGGLVVAFGLLSIVRGFR